MSANVKDMTVKSISVVISLQTSLMQDQCKSVRVSADFDGKYQSDDEAKHNMCFNDISQFRCLVTMHELNLKFTLQTWQATHVSSHLFSGGPREQQKSSLQV